jgi:peptide/nickel transport system ATP-binding protein
MSTSDKILDVKDLSIAFKGTNDTTEVVHGIDFCLYKGETLGIVGESGSGKSVTAMSLVQLLPKTASYPSGSIEFDSSEGRVDILTLEEKELLKIRGNQIAMIFQNPMNSLNPSHRCGDQVLEAILLHSDFKKAEAKKVVFKLFEKVQLPDVERIYNSYPHQLSGGQIQRIMIAMAVSCNPAILIADEPTTALDVTVQQSILELLDDIKKEYKTSTIFISHDLGVVKRIADRVLVMYQGRIVEAGSTEEIFNNPKHPYTKGLIDCRPPTNRRIRRLPTIKDYLEAENQPVLSKPKFKELGNSEIETRLSNLVNSEPILEVKNLSKYYPKEKNFLGSVKSWTKAVDDVSFTMKKGETLGLVGESGSGKSTLGKTILKLLSATSGSVYFKDKSVFDLPSKELKALRRNFQIIFQNPYASLNPRMKIGAAIVEPMTVHKLHKDAKNRKDKAIELMELVGLSSEQYNRYPHQFSGGQRQRICIARTLSLNPEFIICDECVSALDVSVQAQILNLLCDLKDKLNLSYVFISHDLSVVKHISDHIMVMQNGKIVEKNDAETLFHNPQKDYTRKLLKAIYD